MPAPTIVENASGKTLVTNAGSNGKFLAVMDLDVRDGKVQDFRYKLLPVFSNLLPADPQMAAYIEKVRSPISTSSAKNSRSPRGCSIGAATSMVPGTSSSWMR